MKVIRVVEDMSGSGVIMIRLLDVIRMKDVQDQPVGRYDRREDCYGRSDYARRSLKREY